MVFIIIVSILLVALLVIWFKFIKVPKLNNINFISGALGTGKSLATGRFGLAKFWWRVKNQNLRRYLVYFHLMPFKRIRNKILNEEDILFYSDIPFDFKDTRRMKFLRRPFKLKHFDLKESLSKKKMVFTECKANSIELAHVLREKRFNYKSVVVFDEISMFFDQMDFDDKIINEKLNLFFKLFRHETKGGIMIVNSQSINDCHHALKNCLSQYFYIHHKKKLLFGMLLYVQELAYSNDNNVVNVNQGDLEEDAKLKIIYISKKYFHYYDTYAHSWLTDYCKSNNIPFNVIDYGLKSRNLWTLKVISSVFDNVDKTMLNDWQLKYIDTKRIYEKSYILKKYKEFKQKEKEVISNENKKDA